MCTHSGDDKLDSISFLVRPIFVLEGGVMIQVADIDALESVVRCNLRARRLKPGETRIPSS